MRDPLNSFVRMMVESQTDRRTAYVTQDEDGNIIAYTSKDEDANGHTLRNAIDFTMFLKHLEALSIKYIEWDPTDEHPEVEPGTYTVEDWFNELDHWSLAPKRAPQIIIPFEANIDVGDMTARRVKSLKEVAKRNGYGSCDTVDFKRIILYRIADWHTWSAHDGPTPYQINLTSPSRTTLIAHTPEAQNMVVRAVQRNIERHSKHVPDMKTLGDYMRWMEAYYESSLTWDDTDIFVKYFIPSQRTLMEIADYAPGELDRKAWEILTIEYD